MKIFGTGNDEYPAQNDGMVKFHIFMKILPIDTCAIDVTVVIAISLKCVDLF